MDRDLEATPPTDADAAAWDCLYMLGVPSLSDFVRFVRTRTLDGPAQAERIEWIDRWRTAAARFEALAASEAGIADDVPLRPPTPAMARWTERLVGDPGFRRDFGSVPIAFAMVELDRLVVYQRDVMLGHVPRVAARLGAERDEASLLRVCLPPSGECGAVSVTESGPGTFTFASHSHDLRHFRSHVIPATSVPGFEGGGAHAVAVVVGFGSNCLNAVRFNRRLVLNNGYHRAYALRRLGFTHAPCAIQALSVADELEVVGNSDIADDAERLFESPRPPLLKDFLDPALTCVLKVPAARKQIQVSVSVQSLRVAD